MSQYKVSKIISDVEVCMDEIAQNDAEFEGTQDDTERATIIRSKISEAVRFILANADWSLLDPDVVISSVSSWEHISSTLYCGRYVFKDTADDTTATRFLRLVFAKFASWSRALSQEDLIMWNSPEYSMLRDEYSTGTPERPKIALTYEGKSKVLELYSTRNTNSDAVSIGIIQEPADISDEGDPNVSIPARCYRAAIYYIAGLTYVTYADETRSKMMFEQASDIIGFTQMAKAAETES